MNNALIFHMKLSVKNTAKQVLKKPLKTIGIVFLIGYFIAIPFIMKDMFVQFGLNTPYGYVLMSTLVTLYLSMPVTLTYFKRNGINFKKPDVNFMFATPIPPKQVLVYGLLKQGYLQVIMQLVVIVAVIFIFNIPVFTAVVYGLVSLLLTFLLEYSLAVLMYGSERLSENAKKVIKWFVYIMLIVITLGLGYTLIQEGFSLETVEKLLTSPLLILTPVFGWKLGFLQLVFLGANTYNIIASVLYFLSAIIFFTLAYRMKSTGEYYEDGIKFTEKQAILLEKKGTATFSDIIGKKKKVHKVEGTISALGSKAIFSKQWLERKRTHRFYLSLKDLFFLAVSVGGYFMFKDGDIDTGLFFTIVLGFSLYIAVFFSPGQRWKDEFNHFYIYTIPESNWAKLWYATLIEHINVTVQALLLTLPAAILLRVSILEVVLVILAQVAIKILLTYKSILFEGYVESKLGKTVAQFISLGLTVILILVPAILIGLSFMISYVISALIIIAYSVGLSILFMFFATKAFSNVESIKGK